MGFAIDLKGVRIRLTTADGISQHLFLSACTFNVFQCVKQCPFVLSCHSYNFFHYLLDLMPVIFHVEDYEHYKDKKSNFFRVRVEENSVLFVT